MEGTWGRRVSGSVSRGKRYTKFYVGVRMDNGCVVYQYIVVPNEELEQDPELYGFTLDKIVKNLDERLKARHQLWLTQ